MLSLETRPDALSLVASPVLKSQAQINRTDNNRAETPTLTTKSPALQALGLLSIGGKHPQGTAVISAREMRRGCACWGRQLPASKPWSYQLHQLEELRDQSAGTGLDDPSISFLILTAQAVNSSGAAANRRSWLSTAGHG